MNIHMNIHIEPAMRSRIPHTSRVLHMNNRNPNRNLNRCSCQLFLRKFYTKGTEQPQSTEHRAQSTAHTIKAIEKREKKNHSQSRKQASHKDTV